MFEFSAEGECILLDRTGLCGEQQIAPESLSYTDLYLRNFGLSSANGSMQASGITVGCLDASPKLEVAE